ncbi:MAG: hypothetical protein M1830_000319 [Pleopsidium flavum]|nr:MAG: hypothetical protein M1830_000319 [Pleopsidium flavum]
MPNLLEREKSGVGTFPKCRPCTLYVNSCPGLEECTQPFGPDWPYCNAARQMSSVVRTSSDSAEWDELRWRRRLETFGNDDNPVLAVKNHREADTVCQLGELTDKGRETTLALGQRLRHLYVDQLGFMPKKIDTADMIYLRATPIPRALESLHQSFWGLYPPSARSAPFPPPTIITRTPADETLFPNDGNCRRFSQLSRAFAQRTADRWNETAEMDYLNHLISKWMPPSSPRVAVDSHPRLSGIMDTINSTLAHGLETRLPSEFYNDKGGAIIDRIGTEEWFSGYQESTDHEDGGKREKNGNDGMLGVGGDDGKVRTGRGGEKEIKFAMSGCHDTTLAAILASLGTFEDEKWPPYTSHIALELFRKSDLATAKTDLNVQDMASTPVTGKQTWWSSIFGQTKNVAKQAASSPQGIARRPTDELTEPERRKLEGYYVRLRYNDRVKSIPGCAPPGKHLDGDESFCTLEAFKAIVDKFTPLHWKAACAANLDEPTFPKQVEPAGL